MTHPSMPEATIPLFSYGTLQQPEVQLTNYGRLIDGEPDVLAGYSLVALVIDNPHVIAVSGKSTHMIARRTGNPADRVSGTLLLLTEEELEASDAYEDEAYVRVRTTLESGRIAFIYVDESGRSTTGPPMVRE